MQSTKAFLFSVLAAIPNNLISATPTEDLSPRALGICRGSYIYSKSKGAMENILQDVLSNVGGCEASPVEHMYCYGGFCASTQGTSDSIDPETAGTRIGYLQAHGCKGCGSIPLTYPLSNDPSHGILTVDFVSSQVCSGICKRQC